MRGERNHLVICTWNLSIKNCSLRQEIGVVKDRPLRSKESSKCVLENVGVAGIGAFCTLGRDRIPKEELPPGLRWSAQGRSSPSLTHLSLLAEILVLFWREQVCLLNSREVALVPHQRTLLEEAVGGGVSSSLWGKLFLERCLMEHIQLPNCPRE